MDKRLTQRDIGFIQGIAFSARMAEEFHVNGSDLITESNIKPSLFRKYADEYDLEKLNEILDLIEKASKTTK